MLIWLQNGSFIVRDSRHAGPDKPYVITILCRGEIFHVPIRRRTDACYAVGEEKADELVCRTQLLFHFSTIINQQLYVDFNSFIV